jgi:hypothetical protein
MMLVRRDEGIVFDSSRWDGFELRPGDIIISTPPKCGTTWTQMICALLVLQWIDPAAFFSRGTSGQWRDLLNEADLARYAARVPALASDDLVEWLHREPID